MNRIIPAAIGILLTATLPASAQQNYGPWRMHEWMGWGWGGMFLGPLFMIVWLAILVAVAVLVVRWLGGGTLGLGPSPRTPREILDERYARGEIDREEYMRRRQDIDAR
jgi:putative membrane protein